MDVERVADGAADTTEELLAASRDLLRELDDRLTDDDDPAAHR